MIHLRRLLPRLREHRTRLVLAAVCLLAGTAASLALPWILRSAIDDLQTGVTADKLWRAAALLILVAAAGAAVRYAASATLIVLRARLESDLRHDLFSHLARLPARCSDALRVGDLMDRLTSDIPTACAALDLIGHLAALVTALGALVLLALLDPWLLAITLAPFVVVLTLVHHVEPRLRDTVSATQQQSATVTSLVQENLISARVVRACALEAHEIQRFDAATREYEACNRRLVSSFAHVNLGIQMTMGAGAVVLVWLGGRAVIDGAMSVGDLVAFLGYASLVQAPAIALGSIVGFVERSDVSMARIDAVLDLRAEAESARGDRAPLDAPLDTGRIAGDIELRGLTFAYDEAPVLRDVDLRVPAGTTLAIVGPNGSGKSTLASLIARVHEPPPGTIFVDGRDVRSLPAPFLRAHIGFVPQEPFLFSGTVRDNVALGLSSTSAVERVRDRVDAAVDIARLADDPGELSHGLDTAVGERGSCLSGGQRQRATLARALAPAPPILILDDCFSAVDADTEHRILDRLRRSSPPRTTLLITHRVSTAQAADAIVLLRDGRIVEQGRHDDLIRHGGAYAAAARRQQLEADVEHFA